MTIKPLRVSILAAGLAVSLSASAQDRSLSADSLVSILESYRSANERDIISDFSELLSLPNVATNLSDMERNADHISGLLQSRGFTVELLDGGGAPYIYAQRMGDEAENTLLLYAHYDGQPVIETDWAYPPFTPTLLDAPLDSGGRPISISDFAGRFEPEWRLYARSAGDDKLPIIALIHAIDALEQYEIPLGVNLKLFLDGEEEQGSPTLARVLDQHGDLLAADLMLFCDGPMHQSRRPQLIFGVRGITMVDLTAYGSRNPLHSGHYGNWAPNPIMRLAYLLTTMRGESGRISIDGYYEDVVPLTDAESAAIDNLPDVTERLKEELAIHTPEGNGARLEELIALPSLNARGFVSGGIGASASNVIRPSATVSLDLRLVPDQTPARVQELVENHIAAEGYFIVYDDPSLEILREHEKVMKVSWREGAVPAMRTPLEGSSVQPLIRLMQQVAPNVLLTPTAGGTLPLFEFSSRFTTPIVILPVANHDNNQHAENENIRLQNVWDAITVYGSILAGYGRF